MARGLKKHLKRLNAPKHWMLVGDVPWEMFVESCKRLRIMKGKEAIGLAPTAMKKSNPRSDGVA